jgi:hypothetical protein
MTEKCVGHPPHSTNPLRRSVPVFSCRPFPWRIFPVEPTPPTTVGRLLSTFRRVWVLCLVAFWSLGFPCFFCCSFCFCPIFSPVQGCVSRPGRREKPKGLLVFFNGVVQSTLTVMGVPRVVKGGGFPRGWSTAGRFFKRFRGGRITLLDDKACPSLNWASGFFGSF